MDLFSAMLRFKKLFSKKCSVIAMVHLSPLPGTPLHKGCVQEIVDKACADAQIYNDHGIDAIMVENMHDVPYLRSKHFGPETVASMTRICAEVRRTIPRRVPCGVQILSGGNMEALAVAKACDLDFVRCEGFVFGHIGDEGYIESDAGALLRYRRNIGAENVFVFTDIKKKHSSHAITDDVSLIETAHAAEFFRSDAVILTGTATGKPADGRELDDLKRNCGLPVIVGSGVTADNLGRYATADAVIVGSYFKVDGNWANDVCRKRLESFVEALKNYQ